MPPPKKGNIGLTGLDPVLLDLLRKQLDIPGEYPDDIILDDSKMGLPFQEGDPTTILRVPRSPAFRRETPVLGSPNIARLYDQLQTAVPAIRGRASYITPAFQKPMIQNLAEQASNKEYGPRANFVAKYLLGTGQGSTIVGETVPKNRQIYVSPIQEGDTDTARTKETMNTLAHEFRHLMELKGQTPEFVPNKGLMGEIEPRITGGYAGDLFDPRYSMFDNFYPYSRRR